MIRRAAREVRRIGASASPDVLVRASAVAHGETALQRRLLRRPTSAVVPPGPLSCVRAMDEHLHAALDALEAAGVPCAVLEAGTGRRRTVVVTDDHAGAARTALDGLAERSPEGLRVSRVGPEHDRDRVLRLHRGDPATGCDVELWPLTTAERPRPDGGTHPAGTALAPRANRWVRYLEPAHRRPATGVVGGRTVPTYEGLLQPHLLDVTFAVDVVYTWVDGSDPKWLQRKDDAWAATHPGALHASAGARSRFTSHDELRYSLRSLEAYADWVRQVFVVTDGQVPRWLRTDYPRLRVVDHHELFAGADDALPTFNSHAIESRLQHVEGLSEHFLYLNDDVFFGRPVTPELFFEASGLTRFFLTDATIDLGAPGSRDLPVVSAAKQSRAAVQAQFDRTVTQRFQHVAHPLRRSVLDDVADRLPDDVARTTSARFRSPGDLSIAASLAHYVGYATGRAVPGALRYAYCDVTERRAPIKLQRLARTRGADVFCLNETDAPDDHRGHELMASFLRDYFPVPSSFERTTAEGAR